MALFNTTDSEQLTLLYMPFRTFDRQQVYVCLFMGTLPYINASWISEFRSQLVADCKSNTK